MKFFYQISGDLTEKGYTKKLKALVAPHIRKRKCVRLKFLIFVLWLYDSLKDRFFGFIHGIINWDLKSKSSYLIY